MDDLRKLIAEPIDESAIEDVPPHERTPYQTTIPLWNKNIGKPECVVKLMEMIVTSRRMNDTEKQEYKEEFEILAESRLPGESKHIITLNKSSTQAGH